MVTVPHYIEQPDGSELEYEVDGFFDTDGLPDIVETRCLGDASVLEKYRGKPVVVRAADVFGRDDLVRIGEAMAKAYEALEPDFDADVYGERYCA